MPEVMKKQILSYVNEHPFSNAREIGKGIGDDGKLHSLELYCMVRTGLMLAHYDGKSRYPTYTVNPDADPREIEKPTLIYNRKRGKQRNPHIGEVQKGIISMAGSGRIDVWDMQEAFPDEVRSYLRKTADKLVDLGFLTVTVEDGEKRYMSTGKHENSDGGFNAALNEITGWSYRLVNADNDDFSFVNELKDVIRNKRY